MRVVVSNAHWLIKKPDLPQEETRIECRIVPPPRYRDGSWAVVRASELGKVVLWYLVALACRRVPRCHLSIQKQNYILSLIQCQAFFGLSGISTSIHHDLLTRDTLWYTITEQPFSTERNSSLSAIQYA